MDNRYLIQSPIGEGGSGAVFSAWDQQLGREVAIKRIKDDAVIEASIRQEAGILATLNHPNIVTVFDFAADEIGPFVVMELVKGRTLEAIVEEHPLTLPKFLDIANQVCRGLSAAHTYGLVHCDLKPGNLMVQEHRDHSFTVKILDFGLAKFVQDGVQQTEEGGVVIGSPCTISPEQLNGQPADSRSDIYSLGCIFYFALSGRYPHDGADVNALVLNHLNGRAKALNLVAKDVPQPIVNAIMKMVSLNPAARPQNLEEVRAVLNGAARAPSANRPGMPGRNMTQPVGSPARRMTGAVPRPQAQASPQAPQQAGRPPQGAPGTYAQPAEAKPGPMKWVVMALISLTIIGGATWAFLWSSGKLAPEIDPFDALQVGQHVGAAVVVKGTITSSSKSPFLHAYILKFSESDYKAVKIAVRDSITTADYMEALVGKTVQAAGVVCTDGGISQLDVSSLSDLKVIK